MSGLAPVLMVQGTASSAGKSTLVTGLCRLFARQGIHVTPFKAQNMSNNAAVCPDGGEIGRAQHTQALAAGVRPCVDMNPILLKPQAGTSQLIVRGEVRGKRTAADYFGARSEDLWRVVQGSLGRLRMQYDLVICEGAGSPAEINLRSRDLTNMSVALLAGADVLLVSDIDRGGAFASLLGTWEWLTNDERALVRGFVLNKFRGDAALLAPAPALLEERTGVPVLGVVPFLEELDLPEEDAASHTPQPAQADACVQVAVVRLPHLANFDELADLSREARVQVRWVTRPEELRAPDLVILPGTKATIPDLLWLHQRGLADRLRWLATHGTPVLGICGGYQMLGREVRDTGGIESAEPRVEGLGLLAVTTDLTTDKRLAETTGQVLGGQGVWASLKDAPVRGYEMHVGRTTTQGVPAFLHLEAGPDGAAAPDVPVVGTYLHGLLQQPETRHRLLGELARLRGLQWVSDGASSLPPAWDRLADVLAENLRWDPERFPRLPRFDTLRSPVAPI